MATLPATINEVNGEQQKLSAMAAAARAAQAIRNQQMKEPAK